MWILKRNYYCPNLPYKVLNYLYSAGNEGSENKISKNHVSENSASENYGSKSDNSENNGPSHDISENDESQIDTSESDLFQILEELEKPLIDKPANKLREKFLNSLSGQNHEMRPKPLIPTPSFRVVKSESFSSENASEDYISASNGSEDDTHIIQVRIKRVLKPVWEGKMHGVTKIGVFCPLFCVRMLGKSTNYSTGTRPLCSTFWAK